MKKSNNVGILVIFVVAIIVLRLFWILPILLMFGFIGYLYRQGAFNQGQENTKPVEVINLEQTNTKRRPFKKLSTFQKMELAELDNRLKMRDISPEDYSKLYQGVLEEFEELLD
ncbi:MAG: hypothetical protein GX775_05260 [Erysipelothrix sp.]|nr:hypothetical protein [Erysipelothrix sp.]